MMMHYLPCFQGFLHVMDDLAEQVVEVRFDGAVLYKTIFQLFQRKEIVEDLLEIVDVGLDPVDMLEAFVLLLRLRVFFNQRDRRQNDAQRRLELMGCQGHKA